MAHLSSSTEGFFNDTISTIADTPDNPAYIDDLIEYYFLNAELNAQYLITDPLVERYVLILLNSDLYNSRRARDQIRSIVVSFLSKGLRTWLGLCFLLIDTEQYQSGSFTYLRNAHNFFESLPSIIIENLAENTKAAELALEMLYQILRSEKNLSDLKRKGDLTILFERLFELIEELALRGYEDEEADSLNFAAIRVILLFNEQYMLASTTSSNIENGSDSLKATRNQDDSNPILKLLKTEKGHSYKAFGENIIFMLNRERRDKGFQLLILKALYVLLMSDEMQDFFYVNDLCVLIDVFIRELYDLPDEELNLRHTYLRVLHPLLSHPEITKPPHYKKEQLKQLLVSLSGTTLSRHFKPIDPDTDRLLARCRKVPWLELHDKTGIGILGISLQSASLSSTSVVTIASTDTTKTQKINNSSSSSSPRPGRRRAPPPRPRRKPAKLQDSKPIQALQAPVVPEKKKPPPIPLRRFEKRALRHAESAEKC